MAIIGYDPNNLAAYGSFYFADLQGQFDFAIWENISTDLLSVPDFAALGACYVTGWLTPFTKVKSGLDAYGFISAPEARYKIGSYSYGTGYEIIRPPMQPIQIKVIKGTPHYIVYPTQCLEVSRFSINTPYASVEQYEVLFDNSSEGQLDVWILTGRQNSSNSPSNFLATTFNLNLNNYLTVDLKLYYYVSITALQYFADTREFQPILL